MSATLHTLPRAGDLLAVEARAFELLREAQARPSLDNMKRAVDAWRVYEAGMAERFPAKPKGAA